MGLSLGGVDFTAFEIPSVVTFGGKQSLAVYKLPGGVRVVDTLGPDDADISWQGILSSANATDRARALDSLRASGQPIILAWDEFFYSVVIAKLQLSYRSSWWIPYRISCVVVNDPVAQLAPVAVSLVNAVASDLASAAAFANVTLAAAAVAAAGASGLGTVPYAAANLALVIAKKSINNSIQTAEAMLSSPKLQTIVNAAGSLAEAVAARGFVGRAIANYAQVTS